MWDKKGCYYLSVESGKPIHWIQKQTPWFNTIVSVLMMTWRTPFRSPDQLPCFGGWVQWWGVMIKCFTKKSHVTSLSLPGERKCWPVRQDGICKDWRYELAQGVCKEKVLQYVEKSTYWKWRQLLLSLHHLQVSLCFSVIWGQRPSLQGGGEARMGLCTLKYLYFPRFA